MSTPDRLDNDAVAPHGWVKESKIVRPPYFIMDDGVYVPAKREPLVFDGDVVCHQGLVMVYVPIEWPIHTRVRVTEIVEETQ